MATFLSFQSQLVSIMDTLAKTAIFEISKLVDIESRGLKQEISRSQREIASLKNKLQMMESLIWNADEHERNAVSENGFISRETTTPEDHNTKSRLDGPQASNDITLLRIKGEQSNSMPVPSDGDHEVEKSADTCQIIHIKEEPSEVKLCSSESQAMLSSRGNKISLRNKDYERPSSPDRKDAGITDTPALTTGVQNSQMCMTTSAPPSQQDGETVAAAHSGTLEREALLFESSSCTQEVPPVSQRLGSEQTQWNSDKGLNRGDRRFVCTYCSKRFRCFSQLETHQRSHTGEKPFHCTLCGKRYAQKGHLYTHQRTHTGEKPYRCLVCGKGFIQKCTLDMHQRTHTGEKPFLCLRCGKGFTKKCNLKKHQTIHTELSGDFWGAYRVSGQ